MNIPTCAWKRVTRDGVRVVKVCCPACGVWGELADHKIGSDGTVTPSALCGNGDCPFHEHIALDGWKPERV